MLYPRVHETISAGVGRRDGKAPASQRVALVTGASRGMGRAVASRLGGDGLAVAVNDVDDADRALHVVAAIRRSGGIAEAFMGDVTDERDSDLLVAAVARALGPIDVLVLCGVGPQPELRRGLLRGMIAKRSGRVVHVDEGGASDAGLARVWARDLAPAGITVNAVVPGIIGGHGWLMGTREEVAHAVSFVASHGAGLITGQCIVVDGGRSLAG